MVNKLFNWTAGGFFRSLGKFLAYIVIGVLIALICSKNNIKITQLLGFEYVNAQTVTSWSTNQVKINTCNGNGTCTDSSNFSGDHTFTSSDLSNPIQFIQWRLKSSTGLSKENYYTFTFGYKPTPDAIYPDGVPTFKKTGDYAVEDISCSTSHSNGYYLWTCSFEPRENYSSDEYLYVRITFYQGYLTKLISSMSGYKVMQGVSGTITDSTNTIVNNQNENTNTIINNIINTANQQINSQLVCDSIDKKLIIADGYFNIEGNIVNDSSFGVSDYIPLTDKDILTKTKAGNSNARYCYFDIDKRVIGDCILGSLGTNVIPTNTQYVRFSFLKISNNPNFSLCRNGNQALQDTLTDTNVDGDGNDMANYINNFGFQSDGAVASFITLPITFLENVLVSDSTADYCTTYKEKNICLPNGSLIWSKPGASAFQIYFNLVVGGYLFYYMIRSFVDTSEKAINPDNNKVEVMRL